MSRALPASLVTAAALFVLAIPARAQKFATCSASARVAPLSAQDQNRSDEAARKCGIDPDALGNVTVSSSQTQGASSSSPAMGTDSSSKPEHGGNSGSISNHSDSRGVEAETQRDNIMSIMADQLSPYYMAILQEKPLSAQNQANSYAALSEAIFQARLGAALSKDPEQKKQFDNVGALLDGNRNVFAPDYRTTRKAFEQRMKKLSDQFMFTAR